MSITKDVAVRLHLNGADDVKAQLTSVTEQADRLKTKTATLTIDAHDDDFMVDAAKVLAEAKELGATKVRIDVAADSEHARALLDLIRAKADELGLKKVSIKVKVDDAEALTKMSLLSRLFGSGGGEEGAGAGGGAGSALGILAGLGAPLLPGLVAGGAGAGLLGLPVLGGLMNESSASANGGKGELGYVKQFETEITKAEGIFEHWSGVVGKPIFAALDQGLQLVGPLLKDITPVITAMEPVLTKIIGSLGKSISSGAIKDFFEWVAKNGPSSFQAILQLGEALGKLIVVFIGGIGIKNSLAMFQGFTTILSGLAPVIGLLARGFGDLMGFIFKNRALMIGLGIAIAAIALVVDAPITLVIGLIIAIGAAVSWVVQNWKSIQRIAGEVWGDVAGFVSGAFDKVKGAIGASVSFVARIWDDITGAGRKAGDAIGGAFSAVGHIFEKFGHNVALIWDAITKGGPALKEVEKDVANFGQDFRDVFFGAISDAEKFGTAAIHWMGQAVTAVEHFGSEAASWLGKMAVKAVEDAGEWLAKLPGMSLRAMLGLLDAVLNIGVKVMEWFAALPGKIGHALSGLPGDMLRIGENIVGGIIKGIEGAAGKLLSSVGHIASIVTSGLKGLLGISSPSRVTSYFGEMLGEGLALGIESRFDRVQSAALKLAGSATAGLTSQVSRVTGLVAGSGVSVPSGGPANLSVNIGGGSGDELLTAVVKQLRENIRINFGGDVQRWATGR